MYFTDPLLQNITPLHSMRERGLEVVQAVGHQKVPSRNRTPIYQQSYSYPPGAASWVCAHKGRDIEREREKAANREKKQQERERERSKERERGDDHVRAGGK